MKRNLLITAAVLALMSCSKDVPSPSAEGNVKGAPFTEGQQVTLTCGPQQTRVNSAEDSSTKEISFTWETGDKIKVMIGTASSEFTLTDGAGGKTATFTGQMPASGSAFSVQYPVEDPDLSAQTYVAGGLPKDMMKFTASDCTLGSTVELSPAHSALRLNLYGWDRKVGKIVVTNTTADPNTAYTLTCTDPVTVGATAENATPFLLVMPAGTYSFKMEVTSEETGEGLLLPDYVDGIGVNRGPGILIQAGSTMETSAAKEFTEGVVRNMPATSMTQIWAPVNCGYDKDHTYGLLYQWGRKDGSTYGPESSATAYAETGYQEKYKEDVPVDGSIVAEDANYYYWGANLPRGDWLATQDDSRWNGGTEASPTKTQYDPCPDGWRVPTKTELSVMCAHYKDAISDVSVGGVTQKGRWYSGDVEYDESAPQIFLSFAGTRYFEDGMAYYRSSYGLYYSSTVKENEAVVLQISSGFKNNIDTAERSWALSVRCIYGGGSTLSAGGFSENTTW